MRALALALACFLALPGAAAGESEVRRGVVAVLPLVASEGRLAIYEKPVTEAVASRLAAELPRLEVVAVSLESPPERVTLVVDGRIVAQGRDRVLLEANVRDPGRGTAEVGVKTGALPLAQIDALAAELAEKLLAPIQKARGRQRGERGPGGLSQALVEAGTGAAPTGHGGAGDRARPGVLVLWPTGDGLPTADVHAAATPPLYRLVDRLGYAPLTSDLVGTPGAAAIADRLAQGARYALMTEVRSVDFRWSGMVLTARGRVRVTLTDAAGRPLYQKTVATDTLVGSRGDLHPALLRFVVDQAVDMVYPELRRMVGR